MDKPEPLVPPEADMRGLPFMPLDVVRLMDSDLFALSTGDEFKAAVAAWCKCWLQLPAGSLPDDDRILAHLTGAGNRWQKVKDMALRGFVKCSDGRLYHPVVCEKVIDAWAMRQRQRDRSARGNAKRWGQPPPSIRDPHGDAYSDPHGDAGWDRKGQGQGQLREEASASSVEGACAPATPKERANGRSKPKTRLPEGWELDPADCRHAADRGWDSRRISDEAEGFRDHHAAKQTLSGDWHASWRTWVKLSDEFAARNGSRGNGAFGHVAPRSGPITAAMRAVLDRGHMG